ncbi:MAG: hypothetical protein Q8O00_04905 [Holophaga sp.]|nr:hypothetical protein [Holophaga sp.]
MKMSRKAKRYDESVLPGDFQGFEAFQDGDASRNGRLHGALRRQGPHVELEHLSLEHQPIKKQSFAKLHSRAQRLTHQVDYLHEQLEIVDHDRRGMYIQIRSLPPYKDDTQIQFNEITIVRDSVSLKRIAFYRKDEVKRQVPLNMTEAELSRLLADIRQVFAIA